jgi:hypothetical protein
MIYKVLIVCAFLAGLAFILATDPRAQLLRDSVGFTQAL